MSVIKPGWLRILSNAWFLAWHNPEYRCRELLFIQFIQLYCGRAPTITTGQEEYENDFTRRFLLFHSE